MARKKLGEMLIEAGVLDEARLRSALADQRRWGRSLGKTLVEMRLIAEDELVRVLGKQLGLPAIDLDRITVPDSVTSLIPDELARQHQIVAFSAQMKFLDVAMVDPTNLGVIDELRIRTQMNIRPYLCGPRMIERALAKYHGGTQRSDIAIAIEMPDVLDPSAPPQVEQRITNELPRRPSRTVPPPPLSGHTRDDEIDALQARISRLEALVERDEAVLRKLLALLVDKGVATREEIVERLS